MATTSNLILDTRRKGKSGLYPVKIRIIHERKYKDYSVKSRLQTALSFARSKKAFDTMRKDYQFETYYSKLIGEVNDILLKLPEFTFDQFEERYLKESNDWNDVYTAFEEQIENLFQENREGYASSFRSTLTAIKYFRKNKPLSFKDITSAWLKKFEAHLKNPPVGKVNANKTPLKGKSTSTIGVYMRNIRVLFNEALKRGIKAEYPFRDYKPPQAKNKKRPLNIEQMSKIIAYDCKENQKLIYYRDLFLFSFYANGLNLADICHLKWANIETDGQSFTFKREKNKNRENNEEISVTITPSIQKIIDTWCIRSLSKDNFIFPVLNSTMDSKRQYAIVKQLNKQINKYINMIARDCGIDEILSFQYARHSFTSILKNTGTSAEYLKEALGHKNITTTQLYMSNFEDTERKKQANKLESIFTSA